MFTAIDRFIGFPIMIISNHDDGEQRRRHKKRRINKKWLKRYGTYSVPLKPGEVMCFNRTLYMTLPTYRKLKEYMLHEYNNQGCKDA